MQSKSATLVLLFISALTFMSCGETKQLDTDSVAVIANDPTNDQSGEPVALGEPKVYYYDYTESRGVEEALVMTEDEAIVEMKRLAEADGNFFGMELTDGEIVQFMYDEKKATWFLDLPNPVTQESYNADITLEDALNIIRDVYDGKTGDDIKAAYH